MKNMALLAGCVVMMGLQLLPVRADTQSSSFERALYDKTRYQVLSKASDDDFVSYCATMNFGGETLQRLHDDILVKQAELVTLQNEGLTNDHPQVLAVAAALKDLRTKLEKDLGQLFKLKLLGEVSSILGAVVKHNIEDGVLTISQSNYLRELGEKFKQEDAKTQVIPMDSGLKLEPGINGETIDSYRSALRGIMYPSLVSRPDIAYAANHLERFSSTCDEGHWKPLQHLKS